MFLAEDEKHHNEIDGQEMDTASVKVVFYIDVNIYQSSIQIE